VKPVAEQQSVVGVFSNVQDTYKRGESFDISWNKDFDNPVNLSLYLDEAHAESLEPKLNTKAFTGTIPKKIKPGKTYKFQLDDPDTGVSLKSETFTIRRKIPLGIQIPVYVGIGVAAYFIIEGLLPDPKQPFPEPPPPHSN